MKSVLDFYSEVRWRNRHGVMGEHYGPTGHRGLDLAASVNESIPALRGGAVVYRGKSSILGYYVVVQIGAEDFDGYCHVKNWTSKAYLKQGEKVAEVAGPNDYHGTAWDGEHLHITNGTKITSVHTDPRRNPEIVVRRIISQLGKKMNPNQRKSTVAVIRREQPTSKSKDLNRDFGANAVATFDGWIYGETILGNNVWYRSPTGGYFWSGAFTPITKSGLANLNPPIPEPTPAPAPEPTKPIQVSELLIDLDILHNDIDKAIPNSREKLIVMTKLDEARLWLQEVR